ncbi:MAG: bifunctional riboflavin kinase/FAD synthetase [Proteobacteria bacterium]|nr:bifunctional riboflavin kinase/FAD synthetase [Pseudomonadota bacterium]
MELIRGMGGRRREPGRCAVTVGAYDGLHLGHQALIERTVTLAQAAGEPAVLLSFEPLPREYLAPQAPPARLTTLRERWRLLAPRGLKYLWLLRFGEALRNLSAQDFASFLARQVGARTVVVGHDFRYGNSASAGPGELAAAGQRLGFTVEVQAPVLKGGERVSSSAIRSALAEADFARAARALGRRWSMRGRVIAGKRLGRTLGFPTANVPLERRRSPVAGIFAVRVHGATAAPRAAVASLGTRPTLGGGGEALLEAYLFDFEGDLYGREIEVEFVAKLRDEERFATLGELSAQMHRDAAAARRILDT